LARIPVAGPWVTELEAAYVADAALNSWYDRAGEWVTRFEQGFAAHCARAHAASLPSCTSGLHLILAALGIGPGDEVVVPDATWIASAAAITYVGATPVFADIDPATWGLSAETVQAVLTPRTRAVIVVDLYGSMPDLPRLEDLCSARGIPLIEDSAEAVGSKVGDRTAGGFGLASVFSFHGSKTLTTGEGGMVLTDDDELAARIRVLRDHGRMPGDTTFTNGEVAFKYKMSDLQAAFGVAQLERVEELLERKRQHFRWYRERLGDRPYVTMNPPSGTNVHWMVTVVLDPAVGIGKEQLRAELAEREIDSRPFFSPLSSLPAYAGTPSAEQAGERNVASYAICPYGVNLPSALCLDEADVDRVCAAVDEIVQGVPA
jgi:perosamine synthetase